MNQLNPKQFCRFFWVIAPLLTSVLPAVAQSEGWRGIVPLHSTKHDVIEKLGISPRDGAGSYDLETEHVSFSYQRGNNLCGEKNETFAVPLDTVLRITVSPYDYLFLPDLRIDLSQFSKRTTDLDRVDIYHETRGIELLTDEGLVSEIQYYPTAEDEKGFACPSNKKIPREDDE